MSGAEAHGGPGASARYLALGDSYTVGEGVDAEDRWPERLALLLRRSGIAMAPPAVLARTGWTTRELLDAIDADPPKPAFDLVTLLIGVNDQYRGRAAEEYRPQFRRALGRAVALARGDASRVLVLSIPDWGMTPFAEGRDRSRIGAEIDVFNGVNREETDAARARYLDITRHSRAAGTAGMALLVAADGLHPSDALYAAWARMALPHARAALGA